MDSIKNWTAGLLTAAAFIPWCVSGGGNGDHVRGRFLWVRGGFKRTVGLGGLQQFLFLTGHRDLQAPPDGERWEMQQKKLGAAPKVPDEHPTTTTAIQQKFWDSMRRQTPGIPSWLNTWYKLVKSQNRLLFSDKCRVLVLSWNNIFAGKKTHFAWHATAIESLSPGRMSTTCSSGRGPSSLSTGSGPGTCCSGDPRHLSCEGCCCSAISSLAMRVNCSFESQPAKSQHFSVCLSEPVFLVAKRLIENTQLSVFKH